MSGKNLQNIYDAIQRNNKLILSEREKKHISDGISKTNKAIFRGQDVDTVIAVLVKVFGEEIVKRREGLNISNANMQKEWTRKKANIDSFNNPETYNDMRQNQIQEEDTNPPNYLDNTDMAIASLLGLNTSFKIQSLFNPEATYIRNYVVLDSKYRLQYDQGTISRFSWSYVDNANISMGSVNSIGTIKGVKSMRIYQPRIPYVASYMFVESRRINILVEEFQAQSFLAYTGRRFHFSLQPLLPSITPAPEMIELYVDDFGDGEYKFRKPITTFHTLSISFGNPYTIIPFNHDNDTIAFTYGNPTIITCNQPHLFVNTTTYGTITGFNTNNPSADAAVIAAINSAQELTLTNTGANTFTINVNTSTITPTGGLVANIYFEERRVVIPIEFTYLREGQ